jgi:4-alpha-glucanotransferase
MRHAGLIRIDHVIGLMRSFWIPDDGTPGAYVRYPLDAMLAIVAIEAEAAASVVIGEDLGLVPRGLRARLARAGVYGYSVLQYEKDDTGAFRDPAALRRHSLACFGTHDTPTLRGFAAGRDIDWWRRLGWIDADGEARARSARKRDVAALAWLGGGESKSPEALADAAHDALARGAPALAQVQLDDALGAVEAQNLPGTVDAHPNWRRRAPVPVEALATDDHLARIGATMRAAGRGRDEREDAT